MSTVSVSEDSQPQIRSRLRGACEECRRKKARCDSAKRPGRKCTNCDLADIQCNPTIPKKVELQQGYIRILEARIKKLEAYIQEIRPGVDVDQIINGPPKAKAVEGSAAEKSLEAGFYVMQSIPSDLTDVTTSPPRDSDDSDGDDPTCVYLARQMGRLSFTPTSKGRFFGQASPLNVVKSASSINSEVTSQLNTRLDSAEENRGSRYWDFSPWELSYATSPETSYVFPENDLLGSLVSLYFEKTNTYFPILHEPTFRKSLSAGQHYWDPSFGMTVLLVCAIGSRYSQDPLVFSVPPISDPSLSSGWHYYCQVPTHRNSMLFESNLYDLQYYCLAALYLSGTSLGHTVPNILAIGLSSALEQGAHRRSDRNVKPSVEIELQKRAFWALFCLDHLANSFLGRPCAVSHESFDVEYPVECDDDYWETDGPETEFRQPPGKPCSITGFVYLIKLCKILGSALRTLYTPKKYRTLSGQDANDRDMQMVAELDSSMNEWKDSLPSFLQWESQRQDDILFQQSANLLSTFYYIQIQIHRPFLRMTGVSSLSSSFAYVVCTNAARSCAYIQEAAMARDLRVIPNTTISAFTAGIITVLCLMGRDHSGFSSEDLNAEKGNLQRCINILRACEERWHSAGALCNVLIETAAILKNQSKMPGESFSTVDSIQTGPFYITDSSNQAMRPTPVGIDKKINGEDDWEYQRLLSSGMGSLPRNENATYYPGQDAPLFNSNEQPIHNVSASTTNSLQSSDLSPGDEFWSDAPNIFSYFEEWNAHISNVDQL